MFRYDNVGDFFSIVYKTSNVWYSFEDGSGDIWFESAKQKDTLRLYQIDPKSYDIKDSIQTHRNIFDLFYLFFEQKRVIHLDSTFEDHLIFRGNYCFRFNSKSKIWKAVTMADDTEERIYCISEYKGKILAGTSKGRILQFLPDENRFTLFWQTPNTKSIYRIHNQPDGSFWATTTRFIFPFLQDNHFKYHQVPAGYQKT